MCSCANFDSTSRYITILNYTVFKINHFFPHKIVFIYIIYRNCLLFIDKDVCRFFAVIQVLSES